MAELKTRNDIENWLSGQPKQVAVIFAARAALRAAPFLIQVNKSKISFQNSASTIILPTLYAMQSTLSAGTYSDRAINLQVAARGADVALSAARAADADTAAVRAAYAAADAARAASATRLADAAYSSARAAYAAATAADAAAGDAAVWIAFNADKVFLDNGGGAEAYSESELWPGGIAGMPKVMARDWRPLIRKLIALDEDWDVWIDWYKARVNGESLAGQVDLEIAKLDSLVENWKKGAVIANEELRRIIDEFDRITPPEQDITAETVGINSEGQLDFTTVETSSNLSDTPDQSLRYHEVRSNVLEMLSGSANLLAHAKPAIQNFADVLPENIQDAKVVLVSGRGNRLRILLTKHRRAAEKSSDPIDGTPEGKLDDSVASDLENIVATYNKLAFHDNAMRAEDESAGDLKDEFLSVESAEIVRSFLTEDVVHISSEPLSTLIQDIYREQEIILKSIDKNRRPEERIEYRKGGRLVQNIIAFLLQTVDKAKDACSDENGKFDSQKILANGTIITVLGGSATQIIAYVSEVWPWFIEAAKALLRGLT